ncbi:MAG: D-alanyl-D-alanine carboxypeptidase [Lachnospiraceae bacterium]|nr:D-alanyl-D-alanine carboxypeptidase [Lachnospiraceae bacterium]
MAFTYFFTSIGMVYSKENDLEAIDVEVSATDLGISSKSCVLMEATTGTILYDKAKDERVSPASITKIMTLLLIFEELEKGNITMDEEVITSAYAKSMGGSQVFLEEGEKQNVETLIKCIVVASGNDACVAMAEHIAGSEGEFVARMNEKAKELGMNNTNFEDCSGLSDSDNHYTSAYDVALMSRELSVKYPEIHNYSSIWMENITHKTDKGESEFGLSNTNKLLKQYPYATGLKTGSTSKAKYCVSATAKKDNIELIAVVMAAPNYKVRFSEAETLLKYGYGVCKLYSDENRSFKEYIKIDGGVSEKVKVMAKETFNYVSTTEEDLGSVEKTVVYNKKVVAPIKKGDTLGKIEYFIGNKSIGWVDVVACKSVEKADFTNTLKKIFTKYIL